MITRCTKYTTVTNSVILATSLGLLCLAGGCAVDHGASCLGVSPVKQQRAVRRVVPCDPSYGYRPTQWHTWQDQCVADHDWNVPGEIAPGVPDPFAASSTDAEMLPPVADKPLADKPLPNKSMPNGPTTAKTLADKPLPHKKNLPSEVVPVPPASPFEEMPAEATRPQSPSPPPAAPVSSPASPSSSASSVSPPPLAAPKANPKASSAGEHPRVPAGADQATMDREPLTADQCGPELMGLRLLVSHSRAGSLVAKSQPSQGAAPMEEPQIPEAAESLVQETDPVVIEIPLDIESIGPLVDERIIATGYFDSSTADK